MKMHKEIILFSGGLDSFMTSSKLKHRVPWLFVSYGNRGCEKDLERTLALAGTIPANPRVIIDKSLDLKGWADPNDPTEFVPHRNLLLCLVASRYSNIIYLSGNKGDVHPDKNPWWAQDASATLSAQIRNLERVIEIRSFWWNWYKTDMLKWFLKNRKDELYLLKMTRSCYANTELPCGECPNCFRRWVAMTYSGIEEEHLFPPWKSDIAKLRYEDILANRSPYPKFVQETMKEMYEKFNSI
jgi:7-cyano-7-deazaguanine synthase in queuosine biosynthesis